MWTLKRTATLNLVMTMSKLCPQAWMTNIDHLLDDCPNLNFGTCLKCVLIFVSRISITKALIISLLLTTSRIFDIPVYWPILLGYFVILFVITMRKRIQHMIKHRYLPWSIGKRSYSNNAATFKK